jgi:hypothetical protein
VPKRWCIGCRQLYDRDSTGTLRCPACQAANTTARQARPPTASRGYSSAHQAERARLLLLWQPGDPCALCEQPMDSSRGLDLAHNEDRTGWLGLAHQACNRATNQGRRS